MWQNSSELSLVFPFFNPCLCFIPCLSQMQIDIYQHLYQSLSLKVPWSYMRTICFCFVNFEYKNVVPLLKLDFEFVLILYVYLKKERKPNHILFPCMQEMYVTLHFIKSYAILFATMFKCTWNKKVPFYVFFVIHYFFWMFY